ncbi:NAD(P)H-binding protein [Endozoicomonas arenosclerae]|uniref:NAD(P)H-binding protein n=1 Tax=Endozoicomonas arenosclerae TaxID=1633495 RepID=UPI0007846992|nr:NAD(P)H-binding protein [Endozoicomonas arenosclerae]
MSKTAVIIGATGLIGSELLRQLLESSEIEKVISLSRRELPLNSAKLESHIVDFQHLDQYRHLIKGDLFFSCLGTTKKKAGSLSAQRKIDFEYQLEAARIAASNSIPHYLLISSSGANPKSFSSYLKMKGELEDRVKALSFQCISIFQPSLLMGERKEHRFAEELGAKLLPLLCRLPGLRKFRPISDRQLASKMLEIALAGRSAEQVYRLDELFL